MSPKDESRLVEYFSQRHCSNQWSHFLALLLQELETSAGEAQSHLFLRHVGSRLAAELALGEQPTLEALEDAMNRQLGALDWGVVQLQAADKGIRLTHLACPLPRTETFPNSAAAMAAVLEGLYAQWIHEQQDSADDVPLRLTSMEGLRCEFFYGY